MGAQEGSEAILNLAKKVFTIIAAFILLGICYAADAREVDTPESDSAVTAQMEKKWGVRPLSIRQTADGHMIDFRYRVTDAEKASALFSPTIKPILIDEDTGAVMAVPTVPKVGSMRSTRKPLQDRSYAMLFANPQKHIKPGHRVTVVIGDYRAEHLVVE